METIQNVARNATPVTLSEVPAFPAIAVKALQVISKERGQLQELSDLITSNVAISGGILRIANSALFGLRVEITGVLHAIHMLGLERVKGVVVTIAMKSYLDGSLEVPSLRACWRHSLACAVVAKDLAKVGLLETDVAYTAGLMHDVGRLALVAAYPTEYADFLASAETAECDVLQRERDLFGVDHCQAGHLLATRWNLPKMFLDVTAWHHDPPAAGEPAILAVVRRSCRMADALGFSAVHSIQTRTYEEILNDLPERERSRLPRDSSEFTHHIASKINSIETV